MKKYKYKKINDAYIMIEKYYSKYTNDEGWYITKHFADNTKFSNTLYVLKITLRVIYNYSTLTYNKTETNDIIKKIKQHGFKIDSEFNIIDFNKKKFEENLYLWDCQDLGLI